MAVIQNPIIGRAKNKFANAIFSTWKGKNILKSKALTVLNKQTDGQLKQRAKFQFLVHLATLIGILVRKGFKELAIGKTEYNVFMSKNSLNTFLSWSGTAWVPDYSKLEISQGSLDNTSFAVSGATNGSTTVTATFETLASGNQSTGDTAYALIITPNEAKIISGSRMRSDGTAVFTLDTAVVTADVVHVFLFFVSADGKKSSDSQYMTATV